MNPNFDDYRAQHNELLKRLDGIDLRRARAMREWAADQTATNRDALRACDAELEAAMLAIRALEAKLPGVKIFR